jgi:hypothetical protein
VVADATVGAVDPVGVGAQFDVGDPVEQVRREEAEVDVERAGLVAEMEVGGPGLGTECLPEERVVDAVQAQLGQLVGETPEPRRGGAAGRDVQITGQEPRAVAGQPTAVGLDAASHLLQVRGAATPRRARPDPHGMESADADPDGPTARRRCEEGYRRRTERGDREPPAGDGADPVPFGLGRDETAPGQHPRLACHLGQDRQGRT